MNNQTTFTRLSSVVFFLSGGSALIFETVWFRVTSTVLGSSIWSAAAVLMAFMAGLGIGNGIVALRGQRIANPVRLYVIVEVVIGVSGVLTIFYLPALSSAITSLLAQLIDRGSLLNLSRFAIAFSILLIPAIAMGSTLPIMQKALQGIDKSFSYSIARLYGWNTMGAVFGTLLAEFILIQWLGLKATGLFASTLNLIAALLIFKFLDTSATTRTESRRDNALAFPKSLLVGPALAGMFLIALEVIWFRYLTLVHFETSTLFSLMLAIVLVGIASGGLIVARTGLATRDIDKILFYLLLCATLTLVLGFYIFQNISDQSFLLLSQNTWFFAFTAAILMFPTSLISGMLFPLYGERIYRTLAVNTQSSGLLTFANTMGAAVGSGVATFFLLPVLGIENAILCIALGYLLLALISVITRESASRVKFVIAKLGAGLLLAILIFPFGSLNRSFQQYGENYFPGEELVEIRESIYATLRYYKSESLGKADYFRLVTNGFSMTSSAFESERYMKLFVYLPEILHGNLERVLLISYGVGNTADAITRLDSVKYFDVVDISEDVIELSDIIDEARGFSALDDPRGTINIEDGRFFLETTSKKYDLITGEPPPPKSPLIVNLYSREYFQLTREHLNPGGIISYWLPIHQLLASDSAAIIKAFCDVYPDCSLWNGFNMDFILLGSNGGINAVSREKFYRYWEAGIAAELGNIGIENPAMLGSLFLADSEMLANLVIDTPPVTDNFPQRISASIDGIFQSSAFYSRILNPDSRKAAFASSSYIQSIFPVDVIADSGPYFELQKAYMIGVFNPHIDYQVPGYWDALTVVLDNTNLETLPLYLLASSPRQMEKLAQSRDKQNIEYQQLRAKQLLVSRAFGEAIEVLESVLANSNSADAAYYGKLLLVSRALNGESFDRSVINSNPVFKSDESFSRWFLQKFATVINS